MKCKVEKISYEWLKRMQRPNETKNEQNAKYFFGLWYRFQWKWNVCQKRTQTLALLWKQHNEIGQNNAQHKWSNVIRCGCCRHKRGPFQTIYVLLKHIKMRRRRRRREEEKTSSKFTEYLSNRRACACDLMLFYFIEPAFSLRCLFSFVLVKMPVSRHLRQAYWALSVLAVSCISTLRASE